jgi:hypothetical protein
MPGVDTEHERLHLVELGRLQWPGNGSRRSTD